MFTVDDLINSDKMKYILIAVMLIGGYFFLLQVIAEHTQNKRSLPMLSVVLLLVYALIAGPTLYIIGQFGSISLILLSLLLLFACIVLFFSLYGLLHYWEDLNKGALLLFLLYLGAVSYITIFNREEGHSRAILLRFDALQEALRKRSFEPLRHAFLNALLFVPMGFLFPMVNRDTLARMLYVAPMGLMLSTTIEAVQMFLRIGQCDLEDILSNTLGAMLGLVFYKVYVYLFHRDGIEEYEEEDA